MVSSGRYCGKFLLTIPLLLRFPFPLRTAGNAAERQAQSVRNADSLNDSRVDLACLDPAYMPPIQTGLFLQPAVRIPFFLTPFLKMPGNDPAYGCGIVIFHDWNCAGKPRLTGMGLYAPPVLVAKGLFHR
jgi:hypothetical protein